MSNPSRLTQSRSLTRFFHSIPTNSINTTRSAHPSRPRKVSIPSLSKRSFSHSTRNSQPPTRESLALQISKGNDTGVSGERIGGTRVQIGYEKGTRRSDWTRVFSLPSSKIALDVRANDIASTLPLSD